MSTALPASRFPCRDLEAWRRTLPDSRLSTKLLEGQGSPRTDYVFSVIPAIINKTGYLYIFVEMHRLVVDVVLHEEVVNAGQESHLRQGEYVHELFHGVAMRALQDREATLYSTVCSLCSHTLRRKWSSPCHRSHSWSLKARGNLHTWRLLPHQKLDWDPCTRETQILNHKCATT